MYLFLLLLIPILWPIAARVIWHNEINWWEMLLSMTITSLVVIGAYKLSVNSLLTDSQILNGSVIGKSRDSVNCRHSYKTCSSGRSSSCTTHYEHSYDIDWNLNSEVGSVTIDGVSRQGLIEPPRWTRAQIGEPFAMASSYDNYIKVAPDSLFNRIAAQKWLDKVPEYDIPIYDYHRADRVIAVTPMPDVRKWNEGISQILRDLGPSKQANIVMLVVPYDDPMYAEAVATKWLGGKKNDITIIIGSKKYPDIEWVHVLAWSQQNIFQVTLRDLLLEHKKLDVVQTIADIHAVTSKHFKRKSFKDFAYLEEEIIPPGWVLRISFVLSIVSSMCLTFMFHKNHWR